MKTNVERMRYQTESVSYALCLLGLVANVCYFLHMFRNNSLSQTWVIGVDVIYNIVFMLITFLAAENAKRYRLKWSYGIAAIGLLQIVRIFILPLNYYNSGQLTQEKFIYAIVYLSASALLLIAGAVVCYIKSDILLKYLKEIEQNQA